MSKTTSLWSCRECGHSQVKWTGSCSKCQQWNTFAEEVTEKAPRFQSKRREIAKPIPINAVTMGECRRFSLQLGELDRVFGDGLVEGSLILIGGEPGVGKSTLLLQISQSLAQQGQTVLYVCGEESAEQTSLRARRLGVDSPNLYLLSETNFQLIQVQIEQLKPTIAIIDSIQIVYKSDIPSSPGSVAQVREVATEFMHLAKGSGITIFLIGHVTKTGDLAGPRVLEHLVDTVLEFEGDRHHGFRMLRAVKNRFGPTDEIAIFHMKETGLVEVPNPSQVFLQERMKDVAGSVIVPGLEGGRSFLIEIQALVSSTAFSTPSRRSTGIDQNRLALLLAVLEKQVGYQLHTSDIFVALAGGLKITEPALDLGILLAIASSAANQAMPADMVALGEVGLGGEIRAVTRIETRLKEAIHMGFLRCLLPTRNLKGISPNIADKIKLIGVDLVSHAILQAIG